MLLVLVVVESNRVGSRATLPHGKIYLQLILDQDEMIVTMYYLQTVLSI